MGRCRFLQYCGAADHDLSRRDFFGLMAGLLSGRTPGLNFFTPPPVVEKLKKDQKRAILILLSGASQFETLDPKPGTSTGGPFQSIQTSVPGGRNFELMPEMAKRLNRYTAVIRSLSNRSADHGGPGSTSPATSAADTSRSTFSTNSPPKANKLPPSLTDTEQLEHAALQDQLSQAFLDGRRRDPVLASHTIHRNRFERSEGPLRSMIFCEILTTGTNVGENSSLYPPCSNTESSHVAIPHSDSSMGWRYCRAAVPRTRVGTRGFCRWREHPAPIGEGSHANGCGSVVREDFTRREPIVLVLHADDRAVHGWIAGAQNYAGQFASVNVGSMNQKIPISDGNPFVWTPTTEEASLLRVTSAGPRRTATVTVPGPEGPTQTAT